MTIDDGLGPDRHLSNADLTHWLSGSGSEPGGGADPGLGEWRGGDPRPPGRLPVGLHHGGLSAGPEHGAPPLYTPACYQVAKATAVASVSDPDSYHCGSILKRPPWNRNWILIGNTDSGFGSILVKITSKIKKI